MKVQFAKPAYSIRRHKRQEPRHFSRQSSLPLFIDSRELIDAAASLGINLRDLNPDQRRLLIEMACRPMTNAARRRALKDAE